MQWLVKEKWNSGLSRSDSGTDRAIAISRDGQVDAEADRKLRKTVFGARSGFLDRHSVWTRVGINSYLASRS